MKRLQSNKIKQVNIKKAILTKKADNEDLFYDATEYIDLAINKLASIDWSDEYISKYKSDIQQYMKTLTDISNKLLGEYYPTPLF